MARPPARGSTPGALLVVGVVGIGILAPLFLHWRREIVRGGYAIPLAAVLVLIGVFVLRVLVVLSSESAGMLA